MTRPKKAKLGSFLGSSTKGLASDIEKSKLFACRADALLKNIKLHCPGLPQTVLDMNKIQYNKVRLCLHILHSIKFTRISQFIQLLMTIVTNSDLGVSVYNSATRLMNYNKCQLNE